MATPTGLLVPLQLSAFALTEKTCDPKNNYTIAPITQPNYTFLRLHDNLITSDILDHVDLHSVQPAALNSRLTDLGNGTLHEKRLGVYLHWTLPLVYRSGSAAAPPQPGQSDSSQTNRKLAQGYPSSSADPPKYGAQNDYTVPEFRPVPNRWLVTRRIQPNSISPATPATSKIPVFQSWVIESDRLRNINDPDLADKDLEVDVTPSINPGGLDPTNPSVIQNQAEVFIGKSTVAEEWDPKAADAAARVDLTVLTSSNPIFPDYQPHNSNVFSMVDNFKYKSSDAPDATDMFLDSATCDYFVIGWHSDANHDPFTTDPAVTQPLNDDRLTSCQMQLKSSIADSVKNWRNTSVPTRVLCHAAMYDVKYTKSDVPGTVLAETAGLQLKEKQSIAVGVTPLDALMAYCRAHQSIDSDQDLVQLEKDLLRLQTLLTTSESDDVDALQAAADESYEQAFSKTDGGTLWHFHQETDPTARPTTIELGFLNDLNAYQSVYSNMVREVSSTRWQLFAKWWQYVSGLGQDQNITDYQNKISALVQRLTDLLGPQGNQTYLNGKMKVDTDALSSPQNNKVPQQGTADRFYQRKEPTILFGNIKSGFESDFSQNTQVRLQDQVVVPPSGTVEAGWETWSTHLDKTIALLPSELQVSSRALCMEFYQLRSSNPVTNVTLPQVIPWFHDETDDLRKESRGRDRWQNTQPWCPLFIEYEAVYYHIPFEKWKLKSSPRLSNFGASVIHYGFDEDIGKYFEQTGLADQRTVSGRVLLLPQAGSTLSTNLQQIFANTNANDLENIYKMPLTEQTNLLGGLSRLEFVSSPLTGMTSDLLTLHEGGAHVKPTVRLANSTPVFIQAAVDVAKPINVTSNIITLMDAETTLTPYGGSVAVNSGASPLKLVTHGQLMFTKINVVDKFGQAISAIDPSPHHYDAPVATISPCLSDTYFPGTIGDTDPTLPASRANTVIPQADNNACPFVQLPPAINQPARLNTSFVQNVNGAWQPCTEWDNPIWGWLVVNYAEQGLQVFLKDGTFYREVRLGGSTGTEKTPKWLPYNPPTTIPNTTQLDFLIEKLNDHDYLQGFFDMIMASVKGNQAHAPDTYATYSSAIVGKPVALVNIGWSLELAGAENQNWSTVNTQEPDLHLLKPDGSSFNPGETGGYTFPIKIGDDDRTFDGLVGYFPASKTLAPNTSDVDLTSLYTYYAPATKNTGSDDPRILISTEAENYPLFTPYYFSSGKAGDPLPNTASKFHVFGTIMDPFLPIHAYSAILPNLSLSLPNWTIQDAMKNINAFWRIGPMLVPIDLPPAYDVARALDSNSVDLSLVDSKAVTISTKAAAAAARATATDPTQLLPKVQLPLPAPAASASGADADFRYLQPYVVTTTNSAGQTTKTTEYNIFGISGDAAAGADASQARLLDAPYTAIEGYAQILKSIVQA